MTVSPSDIVRITAKMSFNANDVQNVWHVKHLGVTNVDDEDFVTACAAWMEDVYTEVLTSQSTALLYETIEMFNVTDDAPIDEVDWPTLTAGTSAGQSEPPQVALLLKFSTATARSQGRKYFGVPTESDIDAAGALANDTILDLVSAGAEALAGFTAAGQGFACGNYREDPLRFAVWLSAIVGTYAATQRRRKLGVGS